MDKKCKLYFANRAISATFLLYWQIYDLHISKKMTTFAQKLINSMRKIIGVVLCCAFFFASMQIALAQTQTDWAGFNRYAQANEQLRKQNTDIAVVFYGNSITQIWDELHPDFFLSHGFVGRGIGGQTSSELLVRMRQDVIELHPHTVVIMCGTNDIAQNNGLISLQHTLGNIISMCELAQANHIRPILCSPLPARSFYWNPAITDAPQKILTLNQMIKQYAETHQITYVDYYSAMVNERGGLRGELSEDEVHPNDAGYQIMEPIILRVLQ